MKRNIMVRISGMIMLAIVISLAMLTLIYALQHPNLILNLATVSWNGAINY